MQQIYSKTLTPECDFNKVALTLPFETFGYAQIAITSY